MAEGGNIAKYMLRLCNTTYIDTVLLRLYTRISEQPACFDDRYESGLVQHYFVFFTTTVLSLRAKQKVNSPSSVTVTVTAVLRLHIHKNMRRFKYYHTTHHRSLFQSAADDPDT